MQCSKWILKSKNLYLFTTTSVSVKHVTSSQLKYSPQSTAWQLALTFTLFNFLNGKFGALRSDYVYTLSYLSNGAFLLLQCKPLPRTGCIKRMDTGYFFFHLRKKSVTVDGLWPPAHSKSAIVNTQFLHCFSFISRKYKVHNLTSTPLEDLCKK